MYKITCLVIFSLMLTGCSHLSFYLDLIFTPEEKQLLRESAEDAAICQVSRHLQATMFHRDLYVWQEGSCEIAPLQDELWFGNDQAAPVKRLYNDMFCRQAVNFQLTRYASFCNEYALSKRLGANQSLQENQAWTLNPASRFRTPLLQQRRFLQPYMTTRGYSEVAVRQKRAFAPVQDQLNLKRGNGQCQLQMRIYKSQIDAQGLKPLLVFHGGGWHQRDFHALALESRIPEWTDQGFVVFMPFYRLMGEEGTSQECSGANWYDVKQDAEAALQWVEQQQQEFGSAGKVSLIAQGSGGMLAGWLLAQKPEKIHKAALFYPLLDSKAMLQALKQRDYPDGRRGLERLLNASLSEIKPDNLTFQQTQLLNTFADINQTLPPIRLLHGLQDERIPFSQSVAACAAISGKTPEIKTTTASYECGQSQLYLFAGGQYNLDYCFGTIECPAGNRKSRREISKILKDTNRWLKGVD